LWKALDTETPENFSGNLNGSRAFTSATLIAILYPVSRLVYIFWISTQRHQEGGEALFPYLPELWQHDPVAEEVHNEACKLKPTLKFVDIPKAKAKLQHSL
jgi:hypothetical protein